MALAEEAAKEDKPFIFNISAPFIAQFFKDPLAATSPYWDYIICNETEAAAWAETQGLPVESSVTEIAKKLANLPKKNEKRSRYVVVTQGTEPTVVVESGSNGTVTEYPVHAIGMDKINDTNGAGDAFAGGFVAGIVQGKDLKTAVDMGQWLAKLSIQELGPSYPFPKQTYAA